MRTAIRAVMALAVVALLALIFVIAITGRGATTLLADVIFVIWLGWVNTLFDERSKP